MVIWLRSYTECKYCPGGSRKINMVDEIERQVLKSPTTPVIIAVDLASSLYSMSASKSEVLSGGRHTVYRDRIRHIFKGLVDAGATLVFFRKGPGKKTREWTDDADKKYASFQKILEAKNSFGKVDWDKMYDDRTIYYDTYEQTAKEFGQIHVSFENNIASVTAYYATQVKAFAVIADHTNYLIFPGEWRIWRSKSYDSDSFAAMEYNKTNLMSNLMLDPKHMPIFATLCGNGYMPSECVQHIKYMLPKQNFQKHLADLIRCLCPDGTPLSNTSKDALIELICRGQKTPFSEEDIKTFLERSINFYCSPPTNPETIEPLWLRNYALKTQSEILITIVQSLPFELNQFYIDACQLNVKQFFELALPIFQRQIGIVLRDADDNYTHIVIYKPSHEEPYQRKTVKAIKPTIVLPTIEEILTNPQMELSTKLDILAEILFPGNTCLRKRLNDLDIKNINLTPILKICYLRENNQITTDEADILLLSTYESCLIDNKRGELCEAPKISSTRAFWIAMIYNKLSFFFFDSLTLSGLNKLIAVDTFDGYIFHDLYVKFFQYKKKHRDKLLESVKNLRIYIKNC